MQIEQKHIDLFNSLRTDWNKFVHNVQPPVFVLQMVMRLGDYALHPNSLIKIEGSPVR
jgi:hypothetical protein